jgi:hypothetical protein
MEILKVFLIFVAIFATVGAESYAKCDSEFCENDENYPEEKLNSLNLWQYKFDDEPKVAKSKRSLNFNSNSDFLVEAKLCDSKISFVRPQKLKNVNEQFRTIVNHANYTQHVRMEICTSENFPCTFNIYPKSVKSFCLQRTSTIRLLAFDEQRNCLVTEKFPIPTSCECQIDKSDLLNGVPKDLLHEN